MSRYKSVLINRLRIGHSQLTHSHILCGDEPPTCQLCGLPVSMRHILVEYVGLRDIHTKYFTVSSVAELFQSVDNSIICLLYTSPSPRDRTRSRMPSSA